MRLIGVVQKLKMADLLLVPHTVELVETRGDYEMLVWIDCCAL